MFLNYKKNTFSPIIQDPPSKTIKILELYPDDSKVFKYIVKCMVNGILTDSSIYGFCCVNQENNQIIYHTDVYTTEIPLNLSEPVFYGDVLIIPIKLKLLNEKIEIDLISNGKDLVCYEYFDILTEYDPDLVKILNKHIKNLKIEKSREINHEYLNQKIADRNEILNLIESNNIENSKFVNSYGDVYLIEKVLLLTEFHFKLKIVKSISNCFNEIISLTTLLTNFKLINADYYKLTKKLAKNEEFNVINHKYVLSLSFTKNEIYKVKPILDDNTTTVSIETNLGEIMYIPFDALFQNFKLI